MLCVLVNTGWSAACCQRCKKNVMVAHTRLPSVGFRSWSRFLAVSLQVTWVINPAVGCHYFPPGVQLPLKPLKEDQFRCLVNRGTMGVNSLPKTVTRQRRGCDLHPDPSTPESSTLTSRLPSHPTSLVYSYWLALAKSGRLVLRHAVLNTWLIPVMLWLSL